jgi:histidyl-tRNA synthetase
VIQPRIFKGTRDFLPEEMIKRLRIVELVKSAFVRYGFLPVETPAMEYLDILVGKYGEEGDKLIYPLAYKDGKELALRYDQTVPLSRLIAMYHGKMTFPFKRYQIQPVWRADRPQKGRFREFYQLDADSIGAANYLADAEIVALTNDIFSTLGFPGFTIRLNHRMALRAFTLEAGLKQEQEMALCRCIDKLDKMDRDGVRNEMLKSGFSDSHADAVFKLILDTDYSMEELDKLLHSFADKFDDVEGVENLVPLYREILNLGVPEQKIKLDLSLARGLDYYTGPIFEVVLDEPKGFGSVAGGGRYDKLIGNYCGTDYPATGISFGLDRIYGAMTELGLHDEARTTTKVLVINFGGEETERAMQLAGKLRAAGLPTEVYLEKAKLKKQFGYADKLGIPYVAIYGEDEAAAGTVSLKSMKTGEQETMKLDEAVAKLR